MTAAFWILLVAYVVMSIGFVLLYRSHQRLAALNVHLGWDLMNSEGKNADYRAAYRDLIGDYTRLHTKYKELQRDSD